jgi:phosphoglycerate dehydrogenase-like enzyme
MHESSQAARKKPLILLWLDEAPLYRQAARAAGLDDSLEFVEVPAAQHSSDELLARAEGLLAWKLPPGILPAMPNLRWIQAMAAGVEDWMVRPDLRRSIALTCARGVHSEQMPDNILASIYYVAKPFRKAQELQARRQWERIMPVPLAGQTLGILGLGTIGADLARKASMLGLRVVGIKNRPQPVTFVDEVYPSSELDKVLSQSDFVVVLLPVTPETENIINAKSLAQMKRTAWLFNFARGQHVADDDLIDALNKGVIAGALLDAFRIEPLASEHRFWGTKNLIILPHIGGRHPQRDKFVAALFVENARRFVANQPLQALVDWDRGY